MTGDTLNGSGNDGKIVTTLAVNTAGYIPVIPVPGLSVIDQGIRLPEALGSNH